MSRSCFEKLGNERLTKQFDDKIAAGVNERQAAFEVAADYYNEINSDLGAFKAGLGIDNSNESSAIIRTNELIARNKVIIEDNIKSEDDKILEESYEYKVHQYNYSKSARDNNKLARDNAKLDIMLAVLRNEATAGQIFNPGGYTKLKEQAAVMVRSMMNKGKESRAIFELENRNYFATQNMAGKQMVGIAAGVDVTVPEKYHDSLAFDASGTRIGVTHSDKAGSPDKLGNWWMGQSHGEMPTAHADILLCGHWHSLRVQQSGNKKWIIVGSASDRGSSWFTNARGEQSVSGVTAFVTRDGLWHDLRVL